MQPSNFLCSQQNFAQPNLPGSSNAPILEMHDTEKWKKTQFVLSNFPESKECVLKCILSGLTLKFQKGLSRTKATPNKKARDPVDLGLLKTILEYISAC